jgi:anti-sigma regulatory factor (Ser/Thr protein kinase)
MTSNDVTPRKQTAHDHTWQTLIEFSLSRGPGSERLAVDRVVEAVQSLNWPAAHLEQLKLALVQATRNTMERSHLDDTETPLVIRVLIPENGRAIRAADQAGGKPTQHQASEREAQQTSQLPSRGWSFFLVEKAAPRPGRRDVRHVIELFLYTEGDNKEIRNETNYDG